MAKTYNQWFTELSDYAKQNAPESVLLKQYRDYLTQDQPNAPLPKFSDLGTYNPNTTPVSAAPTPATSPKVAQIAHTGTYDPTSGKVVPKPTPTTDGKVYATTATPTPTPTSVTSPTPTPSPAPTPTPATNPILDEIDKLKQAQLNQRYAALDQARTSSLSNLQKEKSTIAPGYYDKRNQANVQMNNQARAFSEFMAQRGLNNSGVAAQGELMNRGAYQGNVGALNRQEQQANDDIARRTSDVENEYQFGRSNALSDVEALATQQRINELGQQRNINVQQGQFDRQMGLQENQFNWQKDQAKTDNEFRQQQFEFQKAQQNIDNNFRQGQFDWQKQNDLWSQQFQTGQFDYQKERDRVADQQWGSQYQLQLDEFAWSKNPNNPTVRGQILSNIGQDIQNQITKLELQYLPLQQTEQLKQLKIQNQQLLATPEVDEYDQKIKKAQYDQIQAQTAKIEAEAAKVNSSLSPNYKAAQTQASKLKTQGKSDKEIAKYIMSAGLSEPEESYLINSLKLKL